MYSEPLKCRMCQEDECCPDTHRLQGLIGGFALLFRLPGHDGRSVLPLSAVSLFSLWHGAGARGEGGCRRDQQRRLRTAGLGGHRGKLGPLCLGATVDPQRPGIGGDWGVGVPLFAVVWRVGERTFL